MIQMTIKKNEAGQRLDKYLHKLLPLAPTSFFYKMLRKKNIVLNGKKVEGKEILALGDQVSLYLSEETFINLRGQSLEVSNYQKAYQTLKGIQIVYENDHMLLVNKPSGILTQKAKESDLSVNEWLIGYLLEANAVSQSSLSTFKPSVCNRLDRNTSGLVICSKTLHGSQYLNEAIRMRKIKKYYRLFVKGQVSQAVTLKGYLKKEESINKVTLSKQPSPNASYIETAYYPVQIYPEYTYLEVDLRTGKPHQIRAHMASISHPVLMDEKYGDHSFNKRFQSRLKGQGQLLHAYRLEFPKDNFLSKEEPHVFLATEPADFSTLKNR